jgi:hypothetical protein
MYQAMIGCPATRIQARSARQPAMLYSSRSMTSPTPPRCTPSSTACWKPWTASCPAVAAHLDAARTDILAFTALIRLVGAVLAEQHDEWAEMRRYIGLEILAKSRIPATATNRIPATATNTAEEVTLTAITA